MNAKWLNLIILAVLLLIQVPAQAAPDAPEPASVGIRIPKATSLPNGITPVWAADYGSFTWLEIPVNQIPLPQIDAASSTYQVVNLDIGIHNFRFDPQHGEPAMPEALRAKPDRGTHLRLVQFHGPIDDAWLEDLRSAGLMPLQYYPQNAYLVWGDAQALEQVERAPYMRWSGDFHPAYKINPALTTLTAKMEADDVIENAAITFYNDGALKNTLNAIEGLGGKTIQYFAAQPDGAFQTAILTLPAGRLEEIAGLATVWAIDYVSPKPELDDEVSNQIVTDNYSDGVPTTGYQAWLTDKGVSGAGVTFADVDTGMDTNDNDTAHLDIRGRIAAFVHYPGGDGSDTNGHGTHTGGIIAGNAAMGVGDADGFLYGLGMAPQAQLVIQNALMGLDWPPVGGWQVLSRDSVLNGAVGSNNSWGSGYLGSYSAAARTHDMMVRDANFDTPTVAEPLIMVFSASNSGPEATTIRDPKEAKNLITVGASENYRPDTLLDPGCGASSDIEQVVDFSGRGPAHDGRTLPNIVAPGSDVASLRSYNGSYEYTTCKQPVDGQPDYVFMSGSSVACSQVSGGAALIVEWWRGLTGGQDPSPAMVKALLINGATPMASSTIPDNDQGWGRMNLDNVIENGIPSYYYDQDTIFNTTGETWQRTLHVADTMRPVKVSLVWTDAPGAVGASPALVNDLDLVVNVSGTTYLGNDFSEGWSMSGGAADALNNIENVFLPAGTNGPLQITLNASNIAGDGIPYNGDETDQDFALVIYNAMPAESLGYLQGTVSDASTLAPIENAIIQANGTVSASVRGTHSLVDGTYHINLVTDTYTLTVSAYGYQTDEIVSVDVISGMTTLQDISLIPGPSYVLSGVVSDANTGWPLYARVEIAPDGYPAQTVWSDPWSGVYSVTVSGDISHTLSVSPWDGIEGYIAQSREATLTGDTVEDFALDIDTTTCEAPGYVGYGDLAEGFHDERFPPYGWETFDVDHDSGGTEWIRRTTKFHSYPAAARHTRDVGDPAEDGWLRLPQFTLDTISELSFWEYADYASDYGKHSLWICTTDCDSPPANYTEVAEYDNPQSVWRERVTDLSAYAGQTVFLAFRYEGESATSWYIDDVHVSTLCQMSDGGLLAGSVYDGNDSGNLMSGAQIHNTIDDIAVAQETPEENRSDAFYVLYAPLGSQAFTATMPSYQDTSVSGYPIQAGVSHPQDFIMQAGYPHLTPDALHAVVEIGLTTTQQLSVSNSNAYVDFDFEWQRRNNGSVEDVLVVARDSAPAEAMRAALTALNYTFRSPLTEFKTMSVDELLEYQAIFFAYTPDSSSSGESHDLLIAYLDRGGKLYISDDELGFYHRTDDPTGFYGTYLQSTWVNSDYGDGDITGLNIMAGLNPDTTNDPGDGFTVGAEGIRLFDAPDGNAAGVLVERNNYQAIYTSFDLNRIADTDDQVELIRRVADFFEIAPGWLSTDPISGSVAAGETVTVDVHFDSTAVGEEGDYFATLSLLEESPYETITIPVEMTVVSPTLYVSESSGDWSDLSRWTGNPSRLPTRLDSVRIAAGTEVTVDIPSECYNLTVENGARLNITQDLNVHGAVDNGGQLHQEALVDGSGAADFLMLSDGMGQNSFYGVTLDAAGINLGLTQVDIYGESIAGTGNLSQTVATWFDITPNYPLIPPTVLSVTFYYADSALNGNVPATADVYHYAGASVWEPLSKLASGSNGSWEWITAEATAFSPFVIKSPAAPTAVTLGGLSGRPILWGGGLLLVLAGVYVVMRNTGGRKRL